MTAAITNPSPASGLPRCGSSRCPRDPLRVPATASRGHRSAHRGAPRRRQGARPSRNVGRGQRRGHPTGCEFPLVRMSCHSNWPSNGAPPPPREAPRCVAIGGGGLSFTRSGTRSRPSSRGPTQPLGPGRAGQGAAGGSGAGSAPTGTGRDQPPPRHGGRAAGRGTPHQRAGVRLWVGVRVLSVAVPAGAARYLRRMPPPLPRPAQPAPGHRHPQVLVRRPGWGRGLAWSWGERWAGAMCGIGEDLWGSSGSGRGLGEALELGTVARGQVKGLGRVAARGEGLGISS